MYSVVEEVHDGEFFANLHVVFKHSIFGHLDLFNMHDVHMEPFLNHHIMIEILKLFPFEKVIPSSTFSKAVNGLSRLNV